MYVRPGAGTPSWKTRRSRRQIAHCVLAAALALWSTGCFFGIAPSIFVSEAEDGSVLVSISVNGGLNNCTQDTLTEYTCVYLVDGVPYITTVRLTGEAAFTAIMLDPLVVQFPAGASGFAGSFSQVGGPSGGLVIDTPGSLPVDNDRNLVAESGTQLVVFDLPGGVAATGDFSFNINFTLPAGTSTLEMKPLLTGRVDVGGQSFYPPLLPCVTDMRDVPAVSTALPAPGDSLTLPASAAVTCDGAEYRFGPAAPALPPWALTLTIVAILAGAAWQLSQRPRRA